MLGRVKFHLWMGLWHQASYMRSQCSMDHGCNRRSTTYMAATQHLARSQASCYHMSGREAKEPSSGLGLYSYRNKGPYKITPSPTVHQSTHMARGTTVIRPPMSEQEVCSSSCSSIIQVTIIRLRQNWHHHPLKRVPPILHTTKAKSH